MFFAIFVFVNFKKMFLWTIISLLCTPESRTRTKEPPMTANDPITCHTTMWWSLVMKSRFERSIPKWHPGNNEILHLLLSLSARLTLALSSWLEVCMASFALVSSSSKRRRLTASLRCFSQPWELSWRDRRESASSLRASASSLRASPSCSSASCCWAWRTSTLHILVEGGQRYKRNKVEEIVAHN